MSLSAPLSSGLMDSPIVAALSGSLSAPLSVGVPCLLNQNLLLASQYEPGGWLYDNHSRDSGAMVRNADGNIVWAPENLLDGSEGPTVYWTLTGVTHVLTGETYEGRKIHQLTKTSAAGVNGYVRDHGQAGVLSQDSRLYLSVKIEKTEASVGAGVYFTNQGVASHHVAIDTLDGTVTGTSGTGGNHEVIDDGDWWLVRTPVSNYGGTGSDFFSIRFDPSEDVGAVLRFTQPMVSRGGFHDYLPSSGGNPTFAPRLQHDSAGNPLGYLHEPQATNEVVESEDFSTWTATDLTATGGQADPTGGSDAYLLAETATSSGHFLNELSSIAAGEIAMSVFAKRATGGNYLQLRPHGIGSGKAHASFDLDAGTVYATGGTEFVDAYIESMAGGWYRCVLVGDYAVAPSSLSVVISNDGTERPAYTGNTSNAFYIFGAQMELGSHATSYIPTYGLPATRQADTAEIDVPAASDGFAYVTYGDGGETTFAVTPGGTWTIPTDLDDTYSRIIFKR